MRSRQSIARLAVAILTAGGLAAFADAGPANASPSGMNDGTFITNDDGRLEAFGVAPSSNSPTAIYHDYQWNGMWSGWRSLGAPPGFIQAGPVVGINPDHRVEVFVLTSDQELWHMWQDGSPDNGWSDWVRMRTFNLASGVAVNKDPGGNLVVMVAADKGLYQFVSSPTAGWVETDLGRPPQTGQVIGNVILGRNTDGRLEVFAIGGPAIGGPESAQQDSVYRRWQLAPGGAWSGWVLAPHCNAANARGISVANNADGRLELFTLSPTTGEYRADLCHMWQDTNQSGGWSGWDNLGDGTLDGTTPVSAKLNGLNRIEVFMLRSDGTLLSRWQTAENGGWNGDGFVNHGSGFGSFTVGKNADGRLELMGFKGGKPYHSWQVSKGGAWSGWIPLEDG